MRNFRDMFKGQNESVRFGADGSIKPMDALDIALRQSGIEAALNYLWDDDTYRPFELPTTQISRSWLIPSICAVEGNPVFSDTVDLPLLPLWLSEGTWVEVLIYPDVESIEEIIRLVARGNHVLSRWYVLRSIVDVGTNEPYGELSLVSAEFDPIEALQVASGARDITDVCQNDNDVQHWMENLLQAEQDILDEEAADVSLETEADFGSHVAHIFLEFVADRLRDALLVSDDDDVDDDDDGVDETDSEDALNDDVEDGPFDPQCAIIYGVDFEEVPLFGTEENPLDVIGEVVFVDEIDGTPIPEDED